MRHCRRDACMTQIAKPPVSSRGRTRWFRRSIDVVILFSAGPASNTRMMEFGPGCREEPLLSAKSFGERLVLLGKICGLSASALSESIGVSRLTIWNWKRGRKYPRPQRLESLAKALSTSVGALTRG